MAAPKILIADDERTILNSTRALLEEFGYRVAAVDTAERILPAIVLERPDLLLQDVRMPGLDLEALVRSLRADERTRALPVVIFTASMDAEEVVERLDASGFVEKPFKPHQLVTLLENALKARA